MRCFVHHDMDAVAVCRSCLKGACASCARPVTSGVACSDECLPVAERIAKLQLANSRNIVLARVQPLFTWMLVVIFLGLGIDSLRYSLQSVMGWVGVGLAIVVAFALLRARRR